MLKNIHFSQFDFSMFFDIFFLNLAQFWPAWALQKFEKIGEKNEFLTCSVLKDGSERGQGRFWIDFKRIWNRFLKLFGRIWKDER